MVVVGSVGIFFDVQNIPSGDFTISLLLDRKDTQDAIISPRKKKRIAKDGENGFEKL